MSAQALSEVFLDVCTQRDYLDPGGSRPVANADSIVDNVKHLMAFARWARVPTLSCVDAWRPCDACGLPRPCCVLGTPGQRKISYTLLPDHLFVESDNCLCVPLDLLRRHQQTILAKCHRDPFTNPKLDRLLTETAARRYVLFGVGLEVSIRLLALGLLLRQRHVTLVIDACGYWSGKEADMTLRQLEAKGCQVLPTRQAIELFLTSSKRRRRMALRIRRSVA